MSHMECMFCSFIGNMTWRSVTGGQLYENKMNSVILNKIFVERRLEQKLN